MYKQHEPLYTNENISKVKDYIKSGKLPDDLNDVQMKRFIERFKYGYTLKDRIFTKEVPDPVVLAPINFNNTNLYCIVTAWGDEASDPLVVNESNN